MTSRAEINAARTLPDLCRVGHRHNYKVSWLIALARARREAWSVAMIFQAWERSGV